MLFIKAIYYLWALDAVRRFSTCVLVGYVPKDAGNLRAKHRQHCSRTSGDDGAWEQMNALFLSTL